MKINKKLNLVIPVTQDGKTIYVHSMPISREVFERFFLVISKTFAAIYGGGLGFMAGPRVAALMLKEVAEGMGGEDEEARVLAWEDVKRGLVAEIWRSTNVLMPGEKGWETIPYQEVVDRKLIDEDDLSEINNALTFFTVASSMHKRDELPKIMEGASKLWGGQTVLSNCTEYATSLPTLTGTDNSGATPKVSSVAY